MTRPAVLRHIERHSRVGRLPLRLRQPDSVLLMNYITRLEANQRPAPLGDSPTTWATPCANHPDRKPVTNLDGDHLCQECANNWVRAEGDAAHEREAAEG